LHDCCNFRVHRGAGPQGRVRFDGFISIERFQSLKDETRFVSLSLRVAEVMRDYTRDRRAQTPDDSVKIHG
jgi:hypothetical protein